MRIAVNTRFLKGDRLEGVGRYTQQVMRRLVELRPNDEFLFCFDRPFDQEYIFAKNVEGKIVYPSARHPFLWYAWFEWSLPRVLKAWKADVFISPDGHLSLSSDIPSLLVIHDIAYVHFPEQVPFLVRKFYQHFVPRFAQRANKLITVSEYSKRDIKGQFDLGDKSISVIGNGAPADWPLLSAQEKKAVQNKWTGGNPFFCALGAIHPRKNIAGIINGFDAFKSKYKTAHRLLIVGRMAWKTDKVKAALERTNFKADISMIGYQPDEEVRKILGSADALLFLSLFEGFGVPMIEAMQMNVPLVYSQLSVIPEVGGGAGVSVDPLHPEDIANGIKEAIDPANAERFRRGAAEQLTRYNWDHSAAKFSDLIDEINKDT